MVVVVLLLTGLVQYHGRLLACLVRGHAALLGLMGCWRTRLVLLWLAKGVGREPLVHGQFAGVQRDALKETNASDWTSK